MMLTTLDKQMISESDRTRYELPATGITLLGYIVRRMHKTQWLMPVPLLIAACHTEEALAHVAMYAVTASTSFGRAYCQTRFNTDGEEVSEVDPETGAVVRAKLKTSSPTYQISYSAILPHGSSFTGEEEITGTTIGLRGLGMPAPSTFKFQSDGYVAELSGTLTSELAYGFFSHAHIRGYGFLNVKDNTGNTGRLRLDRSNKVELSINDKAWDVAAPFVVERAVGRAVERERA